MYAAGNFTSVDNPAVSASEVAKWNGTSWSALGSGLSGGDVKALAWYNSTLYAGGTFTGGYLEKWTGSAWMPVTDATINGQVLALIVFNNYLYIGGAMTPNSIVKYD